MKTFCFKLYHSDHNKALMRQINIAGLIFNHCIALHKRYYRLFGKYINPYKLMKHLTKLKRTQRFSYMCKLGSQAVQNIVERIDRAYNLFWSNRKRKVKSSPPKFRRVKHYQSFTLKQSGWALNESEGRIRLGKKWYGYFKSRNIEGKVKTVTVKRDAVGDIYVYLSCDIQNKPVEPRTGKIVGFDFGLKRFLTGSDGHNIKSPYFFMLNAKQIKNKCRNLSHKQKSSHNRERARKDLARAYRRMENQRKDFHFKTARSLCKEYAVICLEDLNMKGMARRYGRKVHSLGFSEFVKILEYEAMKFGTQIVFIDRFYPSSQLCSVCGYKNAAVKDLRIREWDCPSCGTHHDRDENAAKNILMAGASAIGGEPVRPVSAGKVR
ncbi:MAG: transposase [Synergistaceae bacterium]|nr:transposase [Synergistaceae bacterium]